MLAASVACHFAAASSIFKCSDGFPVFGRTAGLVITMETSARSAELTSRKVKGKLIHGVRYVQCEGANMTATKRWLVVLLKCRKCPTKE